MKPKLRSSLPKDTLRRITDPWMKIILMKESGSILHTALRDQLYRIPEFIKNHSSNRKIPLKLIPLYIPTLAIDDPVELQAHLSKILPKSKTNMHTALFIIGADAWFDKPDLIATLDTLTHSTPSAVSILYFFRNDIRNEAYAKILSSFSSLFQNVSIYPYINTKDMEHFLRYYGIKFDITLPQEIIDIIIKECGGCMWLAKEALRHYKKYGAERMFDHQEITLRLNILYEELSPSEKSIMNSLATGNVRLEGCNVQTLDFLIAANLIEKKRKSYRCAIPLFQRHILKMIKSNMSIIVDGDSRILVNGVCVDDIFTYREKDLIRLLNINKNKLISRDLAAQTIWGNSQADYNDWSLDMAINRIRNKLQKLGLHREIIKTTKGKGYIFQQSS